MNSFLTFSNGRWEESWYKAQSSVPLGERHQILKWYKAASDHINMVVGNPLYKEAELYGAAPTGEVQALITLAYDVYHLLHRVDLPDEILKRLKGYTTFQGARYKIAVAALFVRAGFEIKFILEQTKKHCEFTARDPETGALIAVEAKSRHRPGALGFPGEIDESRSLRGDVEELINQALQQDPGNSAFVIFVELNVPHVPGIPVQERLWFQDVWASMQTLKAPTNESPDEFNAIILTNFSYHWQGTRTATGGEHLFIVPRITRHTLSPKALGRITAAVESYGSIPREV